MAETNVQLQWSDDQWTRVRQVVYEEARRARVAGNVLPLYGPLAADARFVTKELLEPPKIGEQSVVGFAVDDRDTFKLSTLQTKIYLRGAQVADPELSSALVAFRRAANVLARLEDGIVFRGQKGAAEGPPDLRIQQGDSALWEVVGGEKTPGLLATAKANDRNIVSVAGDPPHNGDELVSAVSKAIGHLEEQFHLGPFACILDQEYFNTAQTPPQNSGGMVLPSDRIMPFLGGGSLLRSSVLPKKSGLVIALGGAPIDLVVATDISVGFLQVTTDPWFVFRVYEKIVLRINQPDAVIALGPTT
jgi:uncharacterized linocin/CFP29 family protein